MKMPSLNIDPLHVRILASLPMCFLCAWLIQSLTIPGHVMALLCAVLIAGFLRATSWGRFLMRGAVVLAMLLAPFAILNPYMAADIWRAQANAGIPQTSVAEFYWYAILFELAGLVTVYLNDKSNNGVQTKAV